MNEEIMAAGAAKPARTLEMVTAEIRYLDAQAGRLVMGHALEIGKRLTEAKALVPYGEWGNYIRDQLGYSQSTANKMMRLFDEYGAAQMGLFGPELESSTFTNLTYSKALALLDIPREERESFVESHDVEAMSTRELAQAIRERDEARKAQEAAEAREKEAREELAETSEMLDKTLDERNARGVIIREHEETLAALEKELAELKSRPVEVAVQEPDPAEVEKRAAELAEAAKEAVEQQAAKDVGAAEEKAAKAELALRKAKEKAREDRETLLAKLKEAEDKLASAGEADKAEAEKLREEAEALRKQLAMSGTEITVFKLRFVAWQDAHSAMMDALDKVPEEQRDKLAAAIEAQLTAWKTE